jgi:hypothetical protein
MLQRTSTGSTVAPSVPLRHPRIPRTPLHANGALPQQRRPSVNHAGSRRRQIALTSGGGGIRTHGPPRGGQRFSRPPRSSAPAPRLRPSVALVCARDAVENLMDRSRRCLWNPRKKGLHSRRRWRRESPPESRRPPPPASQRSCWETTTLTASSRRNSRVKADARSSALSARARRPAAARSLPAVLGAEQKAARVGAAGREAAGREPAAVAAQDEALAGEVAVVAVAAAAAAGAAAAGVAQAAAPDPRARAAAPRAVRAKAARAPRSVRPLRPRSEAVAAAGRRGRRSSCIARQPASRSKGVRA